ncbi:MAG: DUF4878 domain-containing protein [Bacteroidaceae bacterium]|nr:DUF4878 domain-containing protein [Bacteroidaceae bacterium]
MKQVALYTLYLALAISMLVSCRENEHKAARKAAEQYYGYLIDGDVEKYVKAIHDYNELPEEYRNQLRDMFAQYLDNEQKMRGGLIQARALHDTIVDDLYAHILMEVTFGDSTQEQVFLPLILTDKGWKLK